MRMKRLTCLVLVLLMLLPMGAMAEKKPSIQLGVKVGLIYEGETAQLKPKVKNVSKQSVSFASSDMAVATVSSVGVVEGVAPGRAIITVAGGGVEARCGVVVLPKAVTVKMGEQISLPNGTVELYRVRDEDVASVSMDGVITGIAAGSTVVAVKCAKQVLMVDVEVTGVSVEDEDDVKLVPSGDESRVAALDAAGKTDQIVLVEYTGGSSATLSVHEKINGQWVQWLETSAYVGKNGIGKAKEGDKKTPVGTYNLTTPFGNKADPGAKMPYTEVTKYHYWCGSSKSEYYNQLVDSRETGRSYTASDEHLIEYGSVYNYCMFIDYNVEGVAGKGSCIFLHCKGKNPYTAGCVAIDEGSMKQIIQWARPGVKIVIKKA